LNTPKVVKQFLFAIILMSACSIGELQPVPIEAHDMCSFCKMAISEKRFAAEIITEDDQVLKFDDIGCMLRHRVAAGERLKREAIFVMDFESDRWLKADHAWFERSKIKTPMGSGIVAYADPSKDNNQRIRFDDLRP